MRIAYLAATLLFCPTAFAQSPAPPAAVISELNLKKCRVSAAILAHRMGIAVSKIEAAAAERQDGRSQRLSVRVSGQIAGEKAVFAGFCLQTDEMRLVSELSVIE